MNASLKSPPVDFTPNVNCFKFLVLKINIFIYTVDVFLITNLNRMKNFVMTLSLALLLTACADTTTQPSDPMTSEDSSSMASGTQLAGTPMQTETEDGETLVGGDAVAPDETPGEVSFTVLGSNFSFDMEEIRVQEGDEVTINFRSTDGFHDWVVDEFDAATEQVQTDGSTSVTFIADKAGTYEYYCSVGNHRANGMVGTLIVE
jgi:nitrite reductase (NO-forming)